MKIALPKGLKFAFALLALIPLWTGIAALMSASSDALVYVGLTLLVLTGAYVIWLGGLVVRAAIRWVEQHG